MFNWLGNLFPYSDLHSLNLDWILTKMKETAAQAAKAVADAANALAQVAEAKAAALSAQTAAQNAQTAANNAQTAADNAADSAENAVSVAQAAKSAAQTAQSTAEAAKSAAQTAQSTAQTAQSTAEAAKSAAQTAQSTAETAQTAAQDAQTAANNALNKFPVHTADIANGAVLADKIGAFQITSEKIANGAVLAQKLEVNEMRLKEVPVAYPSNNGTLTILYDGTTLLLSPTTNFYKTLRKNFDTTLARLSGSVVNYNDSTSNKTYDYFYVKTPILFYTSTKNTDIRITCGLSAIAGDAVEFDVIIHNNGDGTGTTRIETGNSVISGAAFSCQLRAIPFACELHRAAQ